MEEQLQLELGTGFFKSGTDFDWGNERWNGSGYWILGLLPQDLELRRRSEAN